VTPRCDLLDDLECAIVHRAALAITLTTGETVVDRPLAIAARDGDDRVAFASGAERALSTIARVAPPP
jgi:transcriptional antiterminator Rof (Rho-off)